MTHVLDSALLLCQLFNPAGRVALTQATLSAIPVHMSIALCLSAWAIESIGKLRRSFIWTGSTSISAGKCRVAWEVVCRPKELGGLEVIDLRRFGMALRLRWDWAARTDPSRTWVDLPAPSDKSTVPELSSRLQR
jgi:hypothetical protein